MWRCALVRLPSSLQPLPILQRQGLKQSTYLTGLDVDPDAIKNTPTALKELLTYVRDAIPDNVDYRKHVETYCKRFLKVIEEAPSQGDAEEILGRQFEEIQKDVDAERSVIDMMTEWKPWESEVGQVPQLFAEMKNISQNVRQYREFQHRLGTK